MKRTLAILFLLTALRIQAAELAVTTNAVFCRFASSYFTSHRTGDYLDSGKYLYWPTLNIHCNENSRGGGSIEEANEGRLERKGLAEWATGQQFLGEIWADDNGGYDTNGVVANITNTFRAPTNFFNGTAYTNEGGWAATNGIKWIAFGAIPYTNQFNLGNSEEVRNNAATNAAGVFAFLGVDIFHPLDLIFSNDCMVGTPAGTNQLLFGTSPNAGDLTHPGIGGDLDMAITAGKAIMDTNVNTAIINYGGSSISITSHCVLSSVAFTSTGVSFNRRADRHSMAWDHAGDILSDGAIITNDATAAFRVTAAFSNAFFEAVTFTNVPSGNFNFFEGSQIVWSGACTNGRIDINLFNIMQGQEWNQRVEVLRLVRGRRYCNETNLVDGSASDGQGEVAYDAAATTQWNANKRGDALITAMASPIANLNTKDAAIWAADTPTNQAFSLQQIIPRYAPAHR